jgi:arylsulfatase A-like enzyme
MVADVMKSHGYSTSALRKNQLGDRHKILPCFHGFDEFLGTLIA